MVKTALVTMTDHTDAITSVEWSKLQETLIVSGGNDSFVRLWDSRTAVNTLNLVSTDPPFLEAKTIWLQLFRGLFFLL